MSSTNWRALLFNVLRRQPSSNNYKYKHVSPKIKSTVLRTFTKELSDPKMDEIILRIDRQLFLSSINKIREAIFRDAMGPPKACIKTLRTEPVRKSKALDSVAISSWQNIAPIFSHPLNPFSAIEQEGSQSPLGYRCTVTLASKDGEQKLSHVSWPDPLVSNSCQGVGVSSKKFAALSGAKFINPSDKRPLKVYVVDDVPNGCDGIGLFPAYEPSHRSYFDGLDLCAAVIKRKPCTSEQRSAVEAIVTSMPGSEAEINEQDQIPLNETGFRTLKQLMDASSRCRSLWSQARDHDKTCPGDIIRCTLLSQKVDTNQMCDEFGKHFLLYSVLSQAYRIGQTLEKNATNQDVDLSPVDRYIWQRSQELNGLDAPTSIAEMIDYKQNFDEFLALLSSYYFSIVSEMKASSRNFFHNDDEPTRAVAVLAVLKDIIHNCKPFKMLYPNLALYGKDVLPSGAPFGEPNVSSSELGDEDSRLGERVLEIFKHITAFENEMYRDRFTTRKPLQIEPVTSLKTWKIVIQAKQPLPEHYARALIFNSRVYTQYVTDLSQVTLLQHATCKIRKMIDEDTFVFLYQLQRPPKVDREQMVDEIIGKLESAAKKVQTI